MVEMAAAGRMRDLTALPHAVASLMVGRGEVSAPGVIAPEAPGGPDPDRFLSALSQLGPGCRDPDLLSRSGRSAVSRGKRSLRAL